MWLKAKLAAVGAVLLSLAYMFLRIKGLRKANQKLKHKSRVYEARLETNKTQRKIIGEEQRKLHSRKVELLKELEKEGDEFEGVDNFTNPNEY